MRHSTDGKNATGSIPMPMETNALRSRSRTPSSGAKTTEDEEDDDEEEPRFKYTKLTRELTDVYQDGGATSTSLAAGDTMVLGTHDGQVVLCNIQTLECVRKYRAHTASITALSISPFPPPEHFSVTKAGVARHRSPTPSIRSGVSARVNKSPANATVPSTAPSQRAFIGSASLDGTVCIQSTHDPRDVTLRSFSRPVQALAISPEYKANRSYLSGGLAGSLIYTSNPPIGARSISTTVSATAVASSWLGSIGLSNNTGQDEVLHSGEGAISAIQWSCSGKYVSWVNEHGIKIMRSNLALEASELENAWKRISHIDHPNRPGWEEMSGSWKAQVCWVDRKSLVEQPHYRSDDVSAPDSVAGAASQQGEVEKLLIGWSGTIWIIDVSHATTIAEKSRPKQKRPGSAEIVSILRIDSIISGICLYSANLLVVFTFVSSNGSAELLATGRRKTNASLQEALRPEVRLIDIESKEDINIAHTLQFDRYQSLSAKDYHLCLFPGHRVSAVAESSTSAFDSITNGIEILGGELWNATMRPTRYLGTAVGLTLKSSTETASSPRPSNNTKAEAVFEFGISARLIMQSPYECIMANPTTSLDHLLWLKKHGRYEEAWRFLDMNQEKVTFDKLSAEPDLERKMEVELGQQSVLNDAASSSGLGISEKLARNMLQEIGEKWLAVLVDRDEWQKASEILFRVLNTATAFDRWALRFIKAKKYDGITMALLTNDRQLSMASTVYEAILGHYVIFDRLKFQELCQRWPAENYNADALIDKIRNILSSKEVTRTSSEDGEIGRDWTILLRALAMLYESNGQPRQTLQCLIQLQDADAAMRLIAESHLVADVTSDIPGFLNLRVSQGDQTSADPNKLAALIIEPIQLLVAEAYQGTVSPDTVLDQLEKKYGIPNPYTFLYLRALWDGDVGKLQQGQARKGIHILRRDERLIAHEGKVMVSDRANLGIEIFAKYDRGLLNQLLRFSQAYDLACASKICSRYSYIPESVFLLAKEGRLAQALRLIIDDLGDVTQAVTFAKEQNDAGLWSDLLELSLKKPELISALLREVGTAVDPLRLVERIPNQLPIPGLRDGLLRILREHEVQESISVGVSRVVAGEVNVALGERSNGLRKGLKFDIHAPHTLSETKSISKDPQVPRSKAITARSAPAMCAICGRALKVQDQPQQHLLAFPCRHIYHLSCLLQHFLPNKEEIPVIWRQFFPRHYSDDDAASRGLLDTQDTHADHGAIGPKIDRARLLNLLLANGCPVDSGALAAPD